MTIAISQCMTCKNFDGKNTAGNTCAAFPNGIPSRILRGQFDHTQPFPNDNGVRFEPLPEGEIA